MSLEHLSSGDLYLRMLQRQTNTAQLNAENCSLTDFLKREEEDASLANEEENYLFWHDKTYGHRVVESFEETQKGESEAYAEATEQPHLQALDQISAQQYLERMRMHHCFSGGECHVIDLCCGPGNIIEKIIEQATAEERAKLQFLGIDINADELAKAREKFAGSTSVQFRQGNVLHLRGVAPADAVICNTSLHEFEEPHRLLHVVRNLRKRLVCVKDLLRPTVIDFWHTVRAHGSHYKGTMFGLFCNSLKSSLSRQEMRALADCERIQYEDCSPLYGMLIWAKEGQEPRRTRRAL